MSQSFDPRMSSGDDWEQIEATITAFEAGWIRGDRPSIADHLDESSPLRPAILVELVHAELEFRLKSGEAARVESYLTAYPELRSRTEILISLIRAEWTIRCRREPELTIEHFVARFPDQAGALASTFARSRPNRPMQPGLTSLSSSWMDVALPRRLGKYELRQKVGGGAFGFVFRAWDSLLHHDVAIKIPRPEVAASPSDVHYLLREAKNAIHLRHPNIVAIQDAGPIDGTVCLVSEFIEGMTLADRLRVGPIGVAESVDLMVSVLEGLSHAHRREIIHRDLKPSNILLDRDEIPHLTDFGLAKRATGDSTLSPLGASRVLIGTPAYMAPEQARGDSASVDARSDVYAAGVVLYEMLTGSVPFRGRGRLLQVQIEEADPLPLRNLNDEIPPDLETICLRALAKHPDDRYGSAGAMADDLANFRAGQPILAVPIVAPPPPRDRGRRRGLGRIIAGLIVCGVMAFVLEKWRRMEQRAVADLRSIERITRHSIDATTLPFQFGADPTDEHRRLVGALWARSDPWFAVLADRPGLADLHVDLLIRAARYRATVGADPATRAAWLAAVRALEPLNQVRPASLPRQLDLARGLAALGELSSHAGLAAEARRYSDQAAVTWGRIAEAYRDQLSGSGDQALLRLNLAEAILDADRAARRANDGGSATAVREAEQIADGLPGLYPLSPAAAARLEAVQLTLARRSREFDQPGRAALWGRRALRSVAAFPDSGDRLRNFVRSARASLVIGLAELDVDLEEPADSPGGAAAMLGSAITQFSAAVDLDPANLDLKRDLATAAAGYAALLARRRQHDQADHWLRLALRSNQAVCRARPQAHADLAASAQIRANLARGLSERGRTWAAMTETTAAIVLAQRAAWLAPGVGSYRLDRNTYALALIHPGTSQCIDGSPPPQPIIRGDEHHEVELH